MSVKRRKKPPLTPPVEGEPGNHIPYWAAYLAERCLIILLSHYVTANCSPALRGAPRSGEGLSMRSTKIVESKDLSPPLFIEEVAQAKRCDGGV